MQKEEKLEKFRSFTTSERQKQRKKQIVTKEATKEKTLRTQNCFM